MAGIVALTNGSAHSWIIMNSLAEAYGPLTVLVEPAQSRLQLLRLRMKRQGVLAVLGQVGFVLLQKVMAKRSRQRIAAIIDANHCQTLPSGKTGIKEISSVNGDDTRILLETLKPDCVVVFGTRIIGRKTLAAITVPLINFHSGINPAYRGQAGGYWALAMGDRANAGVTVHLVDAGVDTGEVLYHGRIETTPADDFSSYFYLQAVAIRPLAVKAVGEALSGNLKPFRPSLPSRQYYHPTLWFYLWTGFRHGVW